MLLSFLFVCFLFVFSAYRRPPRSDEPFAAGNPLNLIAISISPESLDFFCWRVYVGVVLIFVVIAQLSVPEEKR
jgi:hypothetical protein